MYQNVQLFISSKIGILNLEYLDILFMMSENNITVKYQLT